MKKFVATSLIAILLAALTCSLAFAAAGDIWLAGYHLLTLQTPSDAKAFQQRVDAVQTRANDLLELRSDLPKITVRQSGINYTIFADNKVFLIVTPADAKVNGTSTQKLANSWAKRLRTVLPDATPIKH